jgi:hypothetical protein
VDKSKNATFLFKRDFIEYHQDRFEDFSLMVFKNEKLIAVLPANKVKDTLYSHQGLSYGGFLVLEDIKIEDYVNAFKSIMKFLCDIQIYKVTLKQLPFIYHKRLSGELDYILNSIKARTLSFDSYFVIDNLKNYRPNRNRKRALVKAFYNQLKLTDERIEYFWESILAKNLKSRFDVKPVHTIDEIKYLINKFPEQIKFYASVMGNDIKAGAIVFITDKVAHIQYSSGDIDRDETSALDFLFHQIIEIYKGKDYLSFGSSSTDSTFKIDKGLAYWKESFGAKTIIQKHLEIETKKWDLLNSVFK